MRSSNAPRREALGSLLAGLTRHRTIVLFVVTVVPLIVAAIVTVTRADVISYRAGDHALIELATRDVFAHPVLLGPYSRFGWHHPGPLLLYVYAVPFHLLGQRPEVLSLTSVFIATGSVTAIAWIAYRRGGSRLLLWTLLVVAAYLRIAEVTSTNIWNPFVTMLPFAVVVFLAWSLACNDWWALPTLVAVGSFVVQSHVGYAMPVAACIAYGVVIAAVGARHDRKATTTTTCTPVRLRLVVFVTILVGTLAWLPPLIEQITHDPGNFTRIARFAADAGQPHSFRVALDRAASFFGALAVLGTGDVADLSGRDRGLAHWSTIMSLLALGTAAVAAWRRHAFEVVKLCALVALLLAVSVFSVTRIEGPLYPYLMRWITTIAVASWVAVGAAAITVFDRARVEWKEVAGRVTASVVVAALVIVSTFAAINAWHKAPRGQTGSRQVADVVAQAEDVLAEAPATDAVVIDVDRSAAWRPASALMLQLERQGYSVQMDRTSEYRVGRFLPPWRLTRPDPDDVVLEVDRRGKVTTVIAFGATSGDSERATWPLIEDLVTPRVGGLEKREGSSGNGQ